ncbi:MAG: MOSC domain-containing protein [Aggregatilineales bacterium]
MAEIVSIVYKPAQTEALAGRCLRVPLETARLVTGYGIEGDVKGGHHKRQLNIMSADTLAALAAEGFVVEPGRMGEQIVVRGLDVDRLVADDCLRLGAAAVVEVTGLRTGCDRLEAYQRKPAAEAAGRLGVISCVAAGGFIRWGDRLAADV